MSVVDDFQSATEDLATLTVAAVRAIYLQLVARQISRDDAALLVAGAVNRANASAVTLADAYLAAQIEEAVGVPVPTTGVAPVDASERLLKAATTILTEAPKTSFTQAEIRGLLRSVGLDPQPWDIAAITREVNRSLADRLDEMDPAPDWTPADIAAARAEHGTFAMADFIELVNESPRKLSERGLFPPPPPHTGGIDPHRDAAHDAWEAQLAPDLNPDDYTDHPPIWEPEPQDAETRLERLARCEPLEAAQNAAQAAIERQDLVEGWTRQMDDDPCQLCRWWWREGRIWPSNHPFQSHKGCNCQPRIVLATNIGSTQYTRRLARAHADTGTLIPR